LLHLHPEGIADSIERIASIGSNGNPTVSIEATAATNRIAAVNIAAKGKP